MSSRVIQRNMFFGAKGDIFKIARSLRKDMTLAELVIWKKLRDRKIFSYKFRRQHPINMFIVDFYCHELKLVIEIDGPIHEETKDYDLNREAHLQGYGIRVLRFSNDQLLYNSDSVLSAIIAIIRELSPL